MVAFFLDDGFAACKS